MTSIESAFQEIDRHVERHMSEVNMPGMVLAVTDRERLLRVASFGYADLAAGKPDRARLDVRDWLHWQVLHQRRPDAAS